MLLQSRLIQGPEDKARKAARGEDEEGISTEWRVEWVDEDTGEPVRERDERLEAERCERLERDDIYAAVTGRPREDVIAEIREDLGIEPSNTRDLPPFAAAIKGGRILASFPTPSSPIPPQTPFASRARSWETHRA